MTKIGCRRIEPRKPLKRIRIIKNPPKPRRSVLRVRIYPLDKLFSQYTRLKANGLCQRCGRPVEFKKLQTCHFHTRANQRVRFDESNVIAADMGCHRYLDSHPLEKVEFFRQRLGEKEFDLLTARANSNHFKIDRQAIEIYLRVKIKELEAQL